MYYQINIYIYIYLSSLSYFNNFAILSIHISLFSLFNLSSLVPSRPVTIAFKIYFYSQKPIFFCHIYFERWAAFISFFLKNQLPHKLEFLLPLFVTIFPTWPWQKKHKKEKPMYHVAKYSSEYAEWVMMKCVEMGGHFSTHIDWDMCPSYTTLLKEGEIISSSMLLPTNRKVTRVLFFVI